MTHNKDNAIQQEETVNIMAEISHRYLPFWPLFILTIGISLFLGHIYLRYQTPQYNAYASIMLKDKETGVESVLNALEGTEQKQNVENEIEILKSRRIMSDVVSTLGLYAQVYVPGRVRHVLFYEQCPVSFVSLSKEPIRPSNGLVSFTYMPREKVVLLNGTKYPVDSAVNLPYGRFKIVVNRNLDVRNNSQYFLQMRPIEDVAKDFLQNLGIQTGSKQSTILNLSFTDPIPKRAEDILNTLIDVYNKGAVEDKNTTAKNTLDFITKRLETLTHDLSNVEGVIQNYKSAHGGIADISTQGTAILGNVQALDEQISQVNFQLTVIEDIERFVLTSDEQTGTVPSTFGINDPQLLQFLNKLNEEEAKLVRLRRTVGEASPAIITVKNQIAQIKPALLENIKSLKQNINTKKSKLQGEVNRIRGQLSTLPVIEKDLIEITRDQSVKKQSVYIPAPET
jgi:tyrosine-protein kinase Etk/Wzc